MKQQGFLIMLFCFLLSAHAAGQLSPGELSQAHAHLEGISNCTQCHVLGQKVTNTKCLACHTEIRSLLDDNSGYHASRAVRGKDCAECHSDHHGRKFDMIRFDEDDFDHDLTGYALTGAHARVDCRQCHVPDYITDTELRKRKGTFLGLGTACINCHDDYHQSTLGNDCAKCHSTEAFAPAEKFDHDDAEFSLRGAHLDVDCIECHQLETRNGREFQRFTDIDFVNCNSCHEDAHNTNLGNDCRSCHSEESFASTSRLRRFDHSITRFPLTGRHRNVDCADCHNMAASPTAIFQDRKGVATNACATCHEDVHEGKFGSNCTECHNEESFRMRTDPDRFDHDLTGFALEGKHETVECRDCHVSESLTDPLPHQTCTACHEDFHEGAFMAAGSVKDCAGCHDVQGFTPSLFTIEDHADTDFPLDGGHLATPCIACHLKGDAWQFRDIGSHCVDCHEDVHEGEIAEVFYPQQDCAICHITASWSGENLFDHCQTEFTLEGAHLRADCAACHVRDEAHPQGQFAGLSMDCNACHDNVHGSQFERNGITDCSRCHAFESWDIAGFDHDQTDFPLEGRHADVACAECHREIEVDGQIMVRYAMESFECIDCHK